jgi:hypothetical protein
MTNKVGAFALSILLMAGFAAIPFLASAVEDDYTFASESVVKGYVVDPGNRNAEDSAYESMIEGDQYADDNFSATIETVTTGSAGGSAFPGALDSNDDNYRTYQEGNTASTDTVKCIRPSADTQKQWDGQTPVISATHYDLLDDTTEGGDGLVTSVNTNTTTDKDIYAMTDPSFAGSPAYDIRAWVIAAKVGGVQSMNLNFGIRIGSTDYTAYTGNLVRDVFTNYSKGWTLDPSDSGEWTLTDLQGLSTYITTSDVSPVPYVTQVGIKIWANYSVAYELDVDIEYTSVTTTSQTTGFKVYCRGMVSAGPEYFDIYAWNYTSAAWSVDPKTTISGGTESDFDFDLDTAERDAVNDKVKLRIVDDSGPDATQCMVSIDVLKPNRIEIGYALEISLTASGISNYGDLWLRVKGYTEGEAIDIKLWNYSASSWSVTVIQVTALSNTWHTFNFSEAYYLSASSVQIQITDDDGDAADTVRTTFFLDVAFVTHYLADPYFTAIEDWPDPCAQFQTVRFNATVWDADNQLPSSGYPKVNISGSLTTMTEVSGGDLDTYNGKLYYFETSALSVGLHYWNITTKDIDSGEILSATYTVEIQASSHLTHYWDGDAADELASTAENWESDILPEDFDSVSFYAASTGNCRWDLNIQVNYFNMTASYDGEVMIAEDLTVVYDLTQSGTSCYLYGGQQTMTVGGNWYSYYFYGNYSTVRLTGTGDITVRNNAANRFWNLWVAYPGETIELMSLYVFISHNLRLMGGTFDPNANYVQFSNATGTFGDYIINGSGTFVPSTGGLGVTVLFPANPSGNRNLTSELYIPGCRFSNAYVGTFTIDLVGSFNSSGDVLFLDQGSSLKNYVFDTNSYPVNAYDFIEEGPISSSVTMYLRESTIMILGEFDISENVILFAGSSNVIMAGANSRLSLQGNEDSGVQTLNNLTIASTNINLNRCFATGTNLYLAKNLTIQEDCSAWIGPDEYDILYNVTLFNQLINHGTLSIGDGQRLNISGPASSPMVGYGTFTGDIYLNGSAEVHYIEMNPPTGRLFINRSITLNTSAGDMMIVSPSTEDFFPISVLDFTETSYGYLLRWNQTASAAVDFNLSLGSGMFYRRFVNGLNEENFTADIAGWVNFTYDKNLSEAISILLADDNLTDALGGVVGQGGIVVSLETIGIIVTLVLGFGTLAFGFLRKEYRLMSGLTWIFGGVFFFTDLHVGFMAISIGLGAILLLTTAVEILDTSKSKR